jgi:hypothetical protein
MTTTEAHDTKFNTLLHEQIRSEFGAEHTDGLSAPVQFRLD